MKVKADLDGDVRLGIIEAVPPGTPTLWCSRMVVVPKKDGSPRHTVDLQNLNGATYRASHHTASPFNQASLVPPGLGKQCWMHGTATILCTSPHLLEMQQHLSRSEEGIDTYMPLKAFMLQEMATQNSLTI